MSPRRVAVPGFVLLVLVILVGGRAWISFDGLDESPAPVPNEVVDAIPGPQPTTEPESPVDVTDIAFRDDSSTTPTPEIEEPEESPTGSLEVTLLWNDDSSFATDFHVFARGVEPRGNRVTRSGRSDPKGMVVLEELPAGAIDIVLENGDTHTANLTAGETVNVTLRVQPGGEIRGRVVDDQGIGIPKAGIWLSSGSIGTRGHEVSETDANGRFRLQGAAKGDRWVGARKVGHGPSDLHRVDEYTAAGPLELEVERTPRSRDDPTRWPSTRSLGGRHRDGLGTAQSRMGAQGRSHRRPAAATAIPAPCNVQWAIPFRAWDTKRDPEGSRRASGRPSPGPLLSARRRTKRRGHHDGLRNAPPM